MLRIIPNSLCCIIGIFLAGCNLDPNVALEKKLEDATTKISVLQSEIESIKKELPKIESIEAQLATQESYRVFDNFLQSLDKIAYLTPGSDGYSPIKFDLGILTVQLSDVKPYANGSKITLKFGNTLSSSVNGLKATIDWGKRTEKGAPANESAKSKEVTFTETLRPGAWTPVTVVLDDFPPTELGFVRVHDVTHTGIQLLVK